jgi:endoglucanase
MGVNLPSAAFGPHIVAGGPRGKHGHDYSYPISMYTPGYKNTEYFLKRGMNSFRLGFIWERLQPVIGKDFDPVEFGRLRDTVTELTRQGAWVVLNPHNYARHEGRLIGSPDLEIDRFSEFWSRLATTFGGNRLVIFGLMNEPHGIAATTWASAANSAITAIRKTGARNLILVPGITYSSARHWQDEGNAEAMLTIRDPLDHMAFEAHIYLNASGTGVDPDCVSETVGVERMQPFTDWLRRHGKLGFLGEFGGGRDPVCLAAIERMVTYMRDNPDIYLGWSYWAAGPRWPPDYFTSIEPRRGGADGPQMQALMKAIQPIASRVVEK